MTPEKPACPTCQDKKKITFFIHYFRQTTPCPDCQPKPPKYTRPKFRRTRFKSFRNRR